MFGAFRTAGILTGVRDDNQRVAHQPVHGPARDELRLGDAARGARLQAEEQRGGEEHEARAAADEITGDDDIETEIVLVDAA